MPIKPIKKKSLSNPTSVTHFHGANGLFNRGAIERDIISSLERPVAGVANVLPIVPVTTTRTDFGTILGFTVSGSEAATPCDTGPTGSFEGATLRNDLGLKIASSNTNDLSEDGTRQTLDDEDLILDSMMLHGLTVTGETSEANILNSPWASAMVEVAMQLEDHATDVVWNGDGTFNGGKGYGEAKGLDLQIATGITDVNSVAQPNLDSVVKSFGWAAPDESPTAGDYVGMNLYQALADIESTIYLRRIFRKALDMQIGLFMSPAQWEWASAVLPFQLESSTYSQTALVPEHVLYIDADRNLRRTDEMRELGAIKINGRVYPVYPDSGLPQFNATTNPSDLSGSEEASHITFLPLTLRGRSVCYWRYNDYRKTAVETANELLVNKWTDDGKIFWTIEQTNVCYKVSGRIRLAPILRTPQFAGKLMYVRHN